MPSEFDSNSYPSILSLSELRGTNGNIIYDIYFQNEQVKDARKNDEIPQHELLFWEEKEKNIIFKTIECGNIEFLKYLMRQQ